MVADRGLAAGIPQAVAGAVQAELPIVCGVWVWLRELGTPGDASGPPEGPPGDVLAWARDEEGLATLVRVSSEAMTGGVHCEVGRRTLEDAAQAGMGLVATSREAIGMLAEAGCAAGAAVTAGENAEGPANRTWGVRGVLEEADRRGIPAVAIAPWLAADERDARAAAVLSAAARRATLEAREERQAKRIGLLDRESLLEACRRDEALVDNGARLAAGARALPTWKEETLLRPGRTRSGEEQALEDQAREGLAKRMRERCRRRTSRAWTRRWP